MHIPRTCNKQYHRAPTRGIPAQTTIKLRFPSLSVVVFIKPLTFHCALTAGGGKRLMQRSPSLTYHAQQTSLAPDLQGGDSSAARVVWTRNLRSDYYILLYPQRPPRGSFLYRYFLPFPVTATATATFPLLSPPLFHFPLSLPPHLPLLFFSLSPPLV